MENMVGMVVRGMCAAILSVCAAILSLAVFLGVILLVVSPFIILMLAYKWIFG